MASGPSMSSDKNIDILLRFLTEFGDFDGDMKKAEKVLDNFEKQLDEVGDKGSDSFEVVSGAIKQARSELGNISRDTGKTVNEIKKVREAFGQLSGAASRAAAISQGIFVTGAGVTGGIFALANKFVQDAETATELTREWKGEMGELSRAGDRVGKVLATEALPALESAVKLANKATSFLEAHPEIARAALNLGIVTAGLGAVGIAVSRGIKLVADIGYIAATANQLLAGRTMEKAGKDMLLAAGGLKGQIGGAVKTFGNVVLTATTVIIGAELGAILGNKIGQTITGGAGNQKIGRSGPGDFGVGDALAALFMLLQTPSYLVVKAFSQIGLVSDQLVKKYGDILTSLDRFVAGLLGAEKILSVLGKESVGSKGVAGTVKTSEHVSKDIVDLYIDFLKDLERAEKNYQESRKDIIDDANKSVQRAYRQHKKTVEDIMEDYAKTIQKLREQFAEESAKAEARFQEERRKALEDAAEEEERIREDLQEKLRQLLLDHNDRIYELSLARDALGIVQENRRYNREKSDAERAAETEIQRLREQTQERLQELEREHRLEQIERLKEFQQQMKDAEEQKNERLLEAKEALNEELSEIRRARAERLRELQVQHQEELARIRENFIEKIRDLDASLLGETELRRQYYALMLEDAKRFFEEYRNALGGSGDSGTHIPSRQSGGYSSGGGLHLLHPKEFVLNPRTTRAAEQVIGGRLSQQALLMALAGGNSRTMQLNDYRRFSGEITPAMRRAIRQDSLEVYTQLMEN